MSLRVSGVPRLVRGTLFLFALLASTGSRAAPYRPADDALILERLPASASAPRVPRERRLDPDLAARLAQAYIERARRSGDPRELGYAQGVLAP